MPLLRRFLIPSLPFLLVFFALPATASAATKYWIGANGGSFTSNSNWSTTSGGANDTTAPGASDVATFDGGTSTNAIISSAINVRGITMKAGYSGILTQSAGVQMVVGATGFLQSGGTFSGGNDTIDLNGPFTLRFFPLNFYARCGEVSGAVTADYAASSGQVG